MVIFQNIVIVNFLFILETFQSGIMAFLTSIHCCLEAHWSVQTKQRENLWTAIPAVNSSYKFNKLRINDCVSRNGCRINTTAPIQMILVSFFSEDNVLSDETKICYIFEYQSNENRAFCIFGKPGIITWGNSATPVKRQAGDFNRESRLCTKAITITVRRAYTQFYSESCLPSHICRCDRVLRIRGGGGGGGDYASFCSRFSTTHGAEH